MKIISITLNICLFALVIVFSSCKKTENYPIIPYIENPALTKISNTTGIDEKGILKFSFTDGDGNIGLAESDTLPPYNPESDYYYNLFITYYEKQNGIYTPVVLPMTNNSRIPVLTPNGENKSIKGDIEVEIFINNPVSNYDTIAFDISIIDRDLNKSNTIRTSDIVIKKH